MSDPAEHRDVRGNTIKPHSVEAESVNTEETTTETIDATEPRGGILPTGKITLVGDFIREPFSGSDNLFDPEIVPRRHYADNEYRVVIGNKTNDDTELYRTPRPAAPLSEWTQIATDILPSVSDTGQVAGIEILSDGTRVFFESRENPDETVVWTGPNLENLTERGASVPEPDGGTFYDEEAGVIHYYPEDSDTADGVSSDKLSHWEIPEDDLLNPTQQDDPLDPPHGVTGDPHINKVGEYYYVTHDQYNDSHEAYRIAIAVGESLDDFEYVQGNITSDRLGGDLTWVQHDSHFEGLTEYSGGSKTIGQWIFWPVPISQVESDGRVVGGGAGPEFWGEYGVEEKAGFKEDPSALNLLQIFESRFAQSAQRFGIEPTDVNGDPVGFLGGFDGDLFAESKPGNQIFIGVAESGQREMTVKDGAVEVNGAVPLEFGSNGAKIFLENGEIKVEDESGNVTTIS